MIARERERGERETIENNRTQQNMGRGKSCAALAAGARSTHYVQLRVEIAGKESNKQEGREEVYSKKRKQMNNPATRSRQEWRSNGRRRTQHTLRIYIQLRVEIAVKESNKWYLLSATPAGAPVINGPFASINYGRYCPAARDEVSRRDGRLPLPRLRFYSRER